MPKNYYIILGIPSNSTLQDIKAAYRRLAKKFHPDSHRGNPSQFQVIHDAYSVLSDPERRKTYDHTLTDYRNRQNRYIHPEPMGAPLPEKVEPLISNQWNQNRTDDSLTRSVDAFRQSSDSLFEKIHTDFSNSHHKKAKRESPTAFVALTPEQALQGGRVRLLVPVAIRCPACSGRGGTGYYECRHCSGTGYLTGERPIVITFPPNTEDNYSVHITFEHYGTRNIHLTVIFTISRDPYSRI